MNEGPDHVTPELTEPSQRRRSVRIRRAAAADPASEPIEQADRRGFLRLAAGAAVAALAESSPAAALTNEPMLIGTTNSPTLLADKTRLQSSNLSNLMPVVFEVHNYSTTSVSTSSTHRAAVYGSSSSADASAGLRIGVFGNSSPLTDTDKRGVGVLGTSNNSAEVAPTVPIGVHGAVGPDASGEGFAVFGQAAGSATGVTGSSVNGIGMRALSTTGIGIVATGLGNAINATSVGAGVGISATGTTGVVGTASSTGDGVRGVSTSGRAVVARSTSNIAVSAESTSGLDLDCNGTGRVRVKPQSAVGAPVAGTYAAGELILDSAGDLFACVVAGTPGTWHRVGSTTTSPATGVFRGVDPFRAYDSRQAAYPVNGALTLGANRVVSVKDAHSPTGTVTLTDVVPTGATAITLNLTIVTPTSPAGFLAVTPGDAASFVASSINWSSAGVVLANGGVAKLDGSRQVKVFAGGGAGAVDFIVDVTGYYL